VLACGDVLFEMNTGRVDLPGGNAEDLKKSIESLSQLDIEYLLPGHMGIVSGADKVVQNFDFIRSNVFAWL
jgi:glyoxylase-like metal-dependent hydrolase (beta-lactamase superfamily II)